MEELERELQAMLRHRASTMPSSYEASSELVGRTARRRMTKVTAVAGVFVIVVAAAVAGAIGAGATKHRTPFVISNPTTAPQSSSSSTTLPKRNVTTTTPPTSTPSTSSLAVQSLGCPTTSVFAPFAVAAPKVRPRDVDVPGLSSAERRLVRSYVGPRAGFSTDGAVEPDVVLGPKGWSCRVYRHNGGGAELYVFPPSAQDSFGAADAAWTTSEQYDGPEVRVDTAVLGHDPDAALACTVFASDPLVQHWVTSSPIGGQCAAPNGRRITGADGTYAFVDADGTRGVGVMRVRATTPTLDGDFSIVTCKLTGREAALCDAILSDYVTRYAGAPPVIDHVRARTGRGGVVALDGRIGLLHLSQSTEADVRSVAGAPNATAQASFEAGSSNATAALPDYRALGYDCTATATSVRIPLVVQPALRGPYCATIYFINVSTHTLAAFESTSPNYGTQNGTKVGMTPDGAQRREGHGLIPHGCLGSFIELGSLYAMGQPITTAAGIVIYVGPNAGDLVSSLATESNTNPVGMLFC
jgi:hypothetical protein